MEKYTTKEYRQTLLKHCGFKTKWVSDKSGFWFEKNIKIGNFKGKLICDEKYHYMEIEVYRDLIMDSKKKDYQMIWKGSWNKFEQLVKKYK